MRAVFDYSMPNVIPYMEEDVSNACAFKTLATLFPGSTACQWVRGYCRQYNIDDGKDDCSKHTSGMDKVQEFYQLCGVNFTGGINYNNSNDTETCKLINAVKPNKAVLVVLSEHVYLVYGFHRENGGDVKYDAYNTVDGYKHYDVIYPVTTPSYIISK
jgi:hypothetical protein